MEWELKRGWWDAAVAFPSRDTKDLAEFGSRINGNLAAVANSVPYIRENRKKANGADKLESTVCKRADYALLIINLLIIIVRLKQIKSILPRGHHLICERARVFIRADGKRKWPIIAKVCSTWTSIIILVRSNDAARNFLAFNNSKETTK